MTTDFFKAAAIATVLSIAAIASATASPTRPVPHADRTAATQVQYYGRGYSSHHAHRPPHHYYRPPHHSYHHPYHPPPRHRGGYYHRY